MKIFGWYIHRVTPSDPAASSSTGTVDAPDPEQIGGMKATLDEIDLVVATKPKSTTNHFKVTGLLLTVLVVLVVGASTFFAVSQIRNQPGKAKAAIDENCEIRNQKLRELNNKFVQLSHLFDVVLANRPPDRPPPAADVLTALNEFKKPVSLVSCAEITHNLRTPP